jgi:hypothetical protein
MVEEREIMVELLEIIVAEQFSPKFHVSSISIRRDNSFHPMTF